MLPVIFCILFPLVRFWYFSIWWFLFLTYSFYFDSLRTGLKQLSQSTEDKVYSYDKCTSYAILNNKDAIQKAEEQIRESVVSNTDPRSPPTSKIQKHLATLCKQQKFETRTYFQLYPSDPIPPRLYGVIKAHKPEKCYPMRAIVSAIGTLAYGISQYLVELIQPNLNISDTK